MTELTKEFHVNPRMPMICVCLTLAMGSLCAVARAQDDVGAATSPATGPATTPATGPATEPATVPAPRNGRNGALHGVTTQPSGGLLLHFENSSIDTVLDELSSAAGFIVVKEVKPEGRVSLVSKQIVTAEEAVPLLNAVLKNAGYTAIQQGRILKIVQLDKAKRLNIPVRSGADPAKIEATDELITQVIPLRYADATQIKGDLTPLVNPNADFTANASSNALIITDTSANIRRIVQIVAALDTSLAGAADVKVFQLQYANAASAAKLINDIFGEQGQGRAQANQATPGAAFRRFFGGGQGETPAGPGGTAGSGQGLGNRQNARVMASSDERTNMLVVSGPPELLAVIKTEVIEKIDANPMADETVFIYHLKNAQSANVENVVNNLFGNTTARSTANRQQTGNTGLRNTSTGSRATGSGGLGSSGSRSATGSRTGTGSAGTFGGTGTGTRTFGQAGGSFGAVSTGALRTATDLSGQVTVIADTDTNSLLVRTKPANFERVREVLAELDRPVAQVLIKVLIAEVTHDNATDLGVEFSALNLRASGLGSSAGTNFGVADRNTGLVVKVMENDFTATLRALRTVGKLDVLSRPYILASDNQLASITVGQEIPFVTSSRITDTNQTINQFEYGDIGILLDVLPHINPDGLVIMDVAPEISALTGSKVTVSPGVDVPVIAKRSAQSRVGIRNGQTIAIGGLMEDRKTVTQNKVPLLGDIPGLGALFRRDETSTTKTELLIFLTPHVVPAPDDLSGMSKDELQGSKLVPQAVEPGAFDEHMQGMQRGRNPSTAPATRPAERTSP